MAGARLIIDNAEVLRRLKRLGALDRKRMLDEIGGYVVSTTTARFKYSRGPDGIPWEPLSDATKLARAGGKKRAYKKRGGLKKRAARIFASARPLVDKGRLRNSITYRVGGDRVTVGTNVIYAGIHQFGGKAGRGRKVTIPARPFLGLNPENRREINAIMRRYVEELTHE